MRDTWNSIVSKLVVIVVVAFLMFGEYAILKVHFSGNGEILSFLGDKWATEEKSVSPVPQPTHATTTIMNGGNELADMVERVGSGVVNIETKVVTQTSGNPLFDDPFFRQFFGEQMQQQEYVQSGLGTGFIITEDGYIVTNQHVIENATEIKVTINGEEEPYIAQVVGEDHALDLAVIKIDAKNLNPLTLGDSSTIRVGEWVTAIGNPYGLDHTVTVGVISATGRPITIGDRTYKDLIQTDAAINPGNSGGPLLNLQGEVVGINTAVSSQAQGIGFAISINTAKEVLDSLIENGKVIRPYIGISMQDVDERTAAFLGIEAKGVVIAQITENSPAQKAGLQQYDVITAMDGTSIDNITQLQAFMEKKKVGDEVQLSLIRGQENIVISVVLAEKP